MMTLQDAVHALAAHGAQATATTRFDSVGTDTRALAPGQLFVALRGERFDGHEFVAAAAQAGAAAAMVDAGWFADHDAAALPLLVVDDTRRALGTLAAAWRARFALPLIGMLLFVNLVLGVISRVAQQMNIFAIGFPITVSVGLIGVLLTLPMMQAPFTMALERMLQYFT